jgi:chromosome segregation ATPase
MRGRYEQALAEVEEMKRRLREHAQHVAAREKELEELRLEVAGRQGRRRPTAPASAPTGPDRSGELAQKIAEAEKREREAVQELALAKAERERLDEREQSIRKVERELAGLRVKLQEERARSTSAGAEPEPSDDPEPKDEPTPPTPLPQPPTEPDLEPAATTKPRRRSTRAS